MADYKLECGDICALGSQDKTDISLRAWYLMITRGVTLYSLKCRRKEAQLAADWDQNACF